MTLNASGKLDVAVVNDNSSCFAALSVPCAQHPAAASAHAATGYKLPIKPLLTFLRKRITSSTAEDATFTLQFAPVVLSVRDDTDNAHCCWTSSFAASPLQYPIHAPLCDSPSTITGFSHDWLEALLLSASATLTKSVSEIILHMEPQRGLTLALPGPARTEISIPPFAFNRFTIAHVTGLVVPAREFLAVMSLARQISTLLSLHFSTGGEYGRTGCDWRCLLFRPLIATLPSLDGLECKFVLATLSLSQYAALQTVQPAQPAQTDASLPDVIEGTDSEGTG